MIQTSNYKGYTIEVVRDPFPVNPREYFDPQSVLICFHKKKILGDKHEYKQDNFSGWIALLNKLGQDYLNYTIKPLYLYSHSGDKLSINPFSDPWDSFQVGWALLPEEADENILEQELNDYNSYLNGECYAHIIKKDNGKCGACHQEHIETIDTCSGFYGDIDLCIKAAETAIDMLIKSLEELKNVNKN